MRVPPSGVRSRPGCRCLRRCRCRSPCRLLCRRRSTRCRLLCQLQIFQASSAFTLASSASFSSLSRSLSLSPRSSTSCRRSTWGVHVRARAPYKGEGRVARVGRGEAGGGAGAAERAVARKPVGRNAPLADTPNPHPPSHHDLMHLSNRRFQSTGCCRLPLAMAANEFGAEPGSALLDIGAFRHRVDRVLGGRAASTREAS